MTAAELRARFRRIPKSARDADQDFAIRIWRGLSWLERAEKMAPSEHEGRFISCWIAFNALYGRLDDDDRPWGDREALGAFVAHVARIDGDGNLYRVLGKREHQVVKLVGEKYLSMDFWKDRQAGECKVAREFKWVTTAFRRPDRLPILQILCERLYIMRIQVFHGASTKGSKLNRRTLQRSAGIMLDLLPVFIEIMLEGGVGEDWGKVCFGPSESE